MSYYQNTLITIGPHAQQRAAERLKLPDNWSEATLKEIFSEAIRMNCQVRYHNQNPKYAAFEINDAYWYNPSEPIYLVISEDGEVVTITPIPQDHMVY